MNSFTKKCIVLASLLFSSAVFAQGIPVLDTANLAQALQQVQAWQQQYQQMAAQYQQLQKQYQADTGSRGLGDILNNPALQQVVPADLAQTYKNLGSNGFNGLTSDAQAIRNAAKIYNCDDKTGQEKNLCEAVLNNNAQTQAYQQNALQIITQRVQQIQSLQSQTNSTQDPKAIAELQARITAENAQVNNDANRIALLQAIAQTQQQAAEQAQRERWLKLMQPSTPTTASRFVYPTN